MKWFHKMIQHQWKHEPQARVFTGKSTLQSGDIEGNPTCAHASGSQAPKAGGKFRLKCPPVAIFQVAGFRLWEKLDNFSSSLRFSMHCVLTACDFFLSILSSAIALNQRARENALNHCKHRTSKSCWWNDFLKEIDIFPLVSTCL